MKEMSGNKSQALAVLESGSRINSGGHVLQRLLCRCFVAVARMNYPNSMLHKKMVIAVIGKFFLDHYADL